MLAKKGPLGKIWLAAHAVDLQKKVPKLQIIATNIPESVDNISDPQIPMALRVSGHLLLGVVRIFSRKVTYLLTDCSEALVKIKDAFRQPGATVNLPQGATTRRHEDITNSVDFDGDMELEPDLELMHFSMTGDEALDGIRLPEGDVENLAGAEAIDWAGTDNMMEDPGFGHDPGYEVFFEEQVRIVEHWCPALPSLPLSAGVPPLSPLAASSTDTTPPRVQAPKDKRRRLSDRTPPAEEDLYPDIEVLRNEEPLEVFRSQEPEQRVPSALLGFGEDIASPSEEEVAPPPMFSEDEPDAFPFGEIEDPPSKPAGLHAAMMNENEPSPLAEASLSQRVGGRQQREGAGQPRRAPKRKMIVDKELQISPEKMRAQLHDTSAIVRKIGDEASVMGTYPEVDSHPFAGPPTLSFLPATVANMLCFQFGGKATPAKKARSERAAPPDELMDSEEPERWRSAEEQEPVPEVTPACPTPSVHAESMPEVEKPEFAEFDEGEFLFDEPLPQDEPLPPTEEIETFKTSQKLPDVDVGESMAVSRGKDVKGKKRASHQPEQVPSPLRTALSPEHGLKSPHPAVCAAPAEHHSPFRYPWYGRRPGASARTICTSCSARRSRRPATCRSRTTQWFRRPVAPISGGWSRVASRSSSS